ncbi:hypothetical protein H6G80_11485 [Nostoc sp. FACHB-87]|uniref:hypothetical protein n=1 Tax=Nostocaceae TaxID=1162 RepID=UPI0016890F8F|nr:MULTISPECIES: hypothetical protein [Nostocaceae]MBD2454703.1 hypothetical protein [Nostoc sp. FACHB-87]MBD2475878.1 hypothetical protein [Anabaena sp. FACHB-83]
MESLIKTFLTFLLAISIAFSGFHVHANAALKSIALDQAQVSLSSDLHPAIQPNETLEIPVNTLTYKTALEIANKTKCFLKRVGVYNNSLDWPLGDVIPLQLVGQKSNEDTFSFAANYQIDCGLNAEKRNVQFSALSGSDGQKKSNIAVLNQDGNQPAKIVWDEMKNYNEKSIDNYPFKVYTVIKQKDQTFIWIYEVTDKK